MTARRDPTNASKGRFWFTEQQMDYVLRASSAAKSKFGIFFFLTSSHRDCDCDCEKAPPRVLDRINDQPWLVMLDVT
jgi:hypothetical protein